MPFQLRGGGEEEMSPYFPSGHRELADWSGDCVIDNLPRRLPDSPEEREVLGPIAQVDMQLLTEWFFCWHLLAFGCLCANSVCRQFRLLSSLLKILCFDGDLQIQSIMHIVILTAEVAGFIWDNLLKKNCHYAGCTRQVLIRKKNEWNEKCNVGFVGRLVGWSNTLV